MAILKIAGRNINNLRCADDTILRAKSEEKLKNFLMKSGNKKSESVRLKLNIKKKKQQLRLCQPVPPLHGKKKGKN